MSLAASLRALRVVRDIKGRQPEWRAALAAARPDVQVIAEGACRSSPCGCALLQLAGSRRRRQARLVTGHSSRSPNLSIACQACLSAPRFCIAPRLHRLLSTKSLHARSQAPSLPHSLRSTRARCPKPPHSCPSPAQPSPTLQAFPAATTWPLKGPLLLNETALPSRRLRSPPLLLVGVAFR